MLFQQPRERAPSRQTAEAADCCTFLGRYGESDLYFCDKGGTTVITRYSSEPDDFAILRFGQSAFDPALYVAIDRAFERSLMTEP